ncbi:jg10440 [Pararge aegeria aegeria]|uniref:Jg10440 protein n=1 Tax=Pararge aegeria aegeria TaxID=348720 RepID=A0A8S4RHL1_9NEOP|nr:jg10440 [Pararge aegeria aegeria]
MNSMTKTIKELEMIRSYRKLSVRGDLMLMSGDYRATTLRHESGGGHLPFRSYVVDGNRFAKMSPDSLRLSAT